MRIVLFLLWSAWLTFGSPSIFAADDPPFTLLHGAHTGGFDEYEFLPDGKLILYSYQKDGTVSDGTVPEQHFEARFKVEFLRWEVRKTQLRIYRGDKNIISSEIRQEGELVYIAEFVWKKVDKLTFFGQLFAETNKQFR